MNEKQIQIKEQRRDWLVKGVLTLILMLVSLFLALLPLLSTFAKNNGAYFYIIGGLTFVALTAFFIFTLVKECKPNIMLTLNARGFVDKKNIGEDVEIEWTNVASVKILGKTDMPFLGITLENNDIVIARAKKTAAEEMRENIDEGLPAILIAQDEVRMSIKELKDLFAKFVREARALESEAPKKTKNNPFSTDDVLRAFGQLPSENAESNTQTIVAPDTNSKNAANESIAEDVSAETAAPVNEQVDITDSSEENDREISPEMMDLLSKAKSSKIDELEKILTNGDLPYSYQKSENVTDVKSGNAEQNSSESIEANIDEADTETEKIIPNIVIEEDEKSIESEISIDLDNSDDSEPQFEITLDSMIENALQDSEAQESSSDHKNISKKKDEIPELTSLLNDLDNKSQKKKKNFVLHEKD